MKTTIILLMLLIACGTSLVTDFLVRRECNVAIQDTLKNYIPKGEVLSGLHDCNNLGGDLMPVTFQNAERSVYFCKIPVK